MGAADEEDAGYSSPAGNNGEEKIYVSVRLRPLNEKEISRNDVSDWECINNNTVMYRNNLSVSERFMYPTAYTFDTVFGPDCSTRQVYDEGAKEVALSVVSGINSSVFAYGQTSSGKTYTMSGITEYAVADIYDYIHKHKERNFLLKFSAMEIYNESVRDLLSSDTTPLRLLDDPERGTVVERLTEETLRDWNHFEELLSVCEAQRQIGETNLNEASSRSHQILRLTIDSSAYEFLGNDKSSTLTGTVNFVDLAGSERASQSLSAGMRLKEGCHINRSLLTLGTVIRKLSKGRTGHIPFRDSKLTRILQSSLGGNARTAIICTMSPARIHVEQSRNTLLFASCAKEVMTNARVNVVVSDKALVKQLQRELARLESELRSAGISNTTSDSTTLLREKDLQIELLANEVKELTRQLELAQSQIVELLRAAAEDRPPITWGTPNNHYPKLRVRKSWKSERSASVSSLSEDLQTVDVGVRSYDVSHFSDGRSTSSSDDENFIQFPDFEDDIRRTNPSTLLSVGSNSFAENDLHTKDTKEQIGESSPDVCKEVKCIEVEELSTNRYAKSNKSSPQINSASPGLIEFENKQREIQEFPSAQPKEQSEELNDSFYDFTVKSPEKPSPCIKEVEEVSDSDSAFRMTSPEIASPWIKVGEEMNDSDSAFSVSSPKKSSPKVQEQEKSSAADSAFVIPSPQKTSPWMTEEGLSASRSLSLRSRSCRARFVGNSPKFHLDKLEDKNESTPPTWYEKEFIGRPEGCQRESPTFNYGRDSDKLSRNNSKSLVATDDVHELQVHIVEALTNCNSTETPNLDVKMPSTSGQLVQEPHVKPAVLEKNVKNVGLDPIQDDGEEVPIPKWPTEFKRLQGEIIGLWHACNVSLVHRSYFFLLFKGDPAHSFYMELEMRRLSFLKDTFSQGNRTMVDGRVLSLNSSKRHLDRERLMLSREMQRRVSTEEREHLFLKWGIPLNGNHRRLQLAHSLWTKTTDIEHVTESASLVAKLVGFEEQEHCLKDMFGLLNFTPKPSSKRSYIWKWLL